MSIGNIIGRSYVFSRFRRQTTSYGSLNSWRLRGAPDQWRFRSQSDACQAVMLTDGELTPGTIVDLVNYDPAYVELTQYTQEAILERYKISPEDYALCCAASIYWTDGSSEQVAQ